MRARLQRSLLLSPLLLAQAGCFLWSSGESGPAPIFVTVTAAARLNPDEQGRALPTVVRVYQLKGEAKVAGAALEDLYRRPKETLGDDLLQVDELVVAPGETESKTYARQREAQVLAVAAVVRRPAGSSWLSVSKLPAAGKLAEFTFALEDYRIERR